MCRPWVGRTGRTVGHTRGKMRAHTQVRPYITHRASLSYFSVAISLRERVGVRVLGCFSPQQGEDLFHLLPFGELRQVSDQALHLLIVGRLHLDGYSSTLKPRRNSHQDLRIEFHIPNPPLDFVFDPRHAREAQPPDFFLETLEPVASSETRVRSDSSQLFAAQDLRDADAVSDRYLFEPVEQIFEMILSGLERFHEREKRFAVGLIQLQPSFLSLWVKTFEPAIGLNLLIDHFLILQ